MLSKKQKTTFKLIIILIFISSFFEIISIGSILPLLTILNNPDDFQLKIIKYININHHSFIFNNLFEIIILIFGMAALASGFIRVILLRVMTKFSFDTGAYISRGVYRNILLQDYSFHLNNNSSSTIDIITNKTNSVIFSILLPLINMISSLTILSAIFILLLTISFKISIITVSIMLLIYYSVYKLNAKVIKEDSHTITVESTKLVKLLQESIGGIRDLILDNSYNIFIEQYSKSDKLYRSAQGRNVYISQSPKYLIEAFALILLSLVIYIIYKSNNDLTIIIPIIGVLALSAQRMLPLVQNIYSSFVSIRNGQHSLYEVLNYLDMKVEFSNKKPIPLDFKKFIEFNNISFSYDNSKLVLNNINLKIFKGERLGLIGSSGSGKSTFSDILMCLISPDLGYISVDGRIIDKDIFPNWRCNISHVPQSVYMSDTSILENIAFGVDPDSIDLQRVKIAAKMASLDKFIDSMPQNYYTRIGERGMKLSGGQKQRIGIARALYRDAQLIIFDEATSALDTETESSVMSAINRIPKQITLLIIAHRLTTLKNCTRIIELNNGNITQSINYEKLNK